MWPRFRPGAHRRTGTFGVGGAVTFLPEKKLQNARKRQLYIRTQIAVKTKTFPILTSNETVIITETQPNSDFLEHPRELMKIAFKNRPDSS